MTNPELHRAIDAFEEALGPEEAKEQGWILPKRKEAVRDPRTAGTVTEERGERIKEQILSDGVIKGYEELLALRITREELQRLAQQQGGEQVTPEEKEFVEYRIRALERFQRITSRNRSLLLLYRNLDRELRSTGVHIEMNPRIEENARVHLEALAQGIRDQVAIKQYVNLLKWQSEGGQVSAAQLKSAERALPKSVLGRGNQGDTTMAVEIDGVSSEEALKRLAGPETALDVRIDWLLSYGKDVPGIDPRAEGENPVDIFLVEFLSRALIQIKDAEIASKKLPKGEREAKKEEFRVLTKLVEDARTTYRTELGTFFIGKLEDDTTGFFDREYAGGTTRKPEDLRGYMGVNVKSREQLTRDKDVQIQALKEHRKQFESAFTVSLLDAPLHLEDIFKKHARFRLVYPTLEGVMRIKNIVPVIRSRLNPLERDKTFKEQAAKELHALREQWGLPDVVTLDGVKQPFDFFNPRHWDAIPPEHWKLIEERARSTKDAVEERRVVLDGKLRAVEGDTAMIERLWTIKHPNELVGVDPDQRTFELLEAKNISLQELLAPDRKPPLTPQEIAAAYFFVFLEMHDHFSQYLEEAGMTEEDFIRISQEHLDSADAIPEGEFPWGWLAVLFGGLVALWLSKRFLKRLPWMAAKMAGKGIRLGWKSARGAARGAAWSAKRIKAWTQRPKSVVSPKVGPKTKPPPLPQKPPPSEMPKVPSSPNASAVPKASPASAEDALVSKGLKWKRLLGPAAIALTAVDLGLVLRRDARLKQLQEYQGIQAAIELLENEDIVDPKAPRRRKELQYLQNRLECLMISEGALKIIAELQPMTETIKPNERATAELLLDRCLRLERFATIQKKNYERLFPVTDYLVTDPKHPEGNVGIDFWNIDQARSRGMEYEERLAQRSRLLDGIHSDRPRGELDDLPTLRAEFERVLDEAADMIEKLRQNR